MCIAHTSIIHIGLQRFRADVVCWPNGKLIVYRCVYNIYRSLFARLLAVCWVYRVLIAGVP